MIGNFGDAVSAYSKALRQIDPSGMEARDKVKDGDFADTLRDAVTGAVGDLRAGEAQSLKAAAGTADINDVVTAVSKAEVTLQTVVTIRDRVIQAYQDILRMPI